MIHQPWLFIPFRLYGYESADHMQEGRLVIDIAEMPIKCPVAPIEFAFLADYYFHLKGIRDRQDLFETVIRRRRARKKMGTIVDDIMTRDPVRVGAEDTLQQALEPMHGNRVKRLIITDGEDHVQGVISRADLIKLYTMR
jgi:CBS domain-containing protein